MTPRNPQAELEPLLMRVIRDRRDAIRELLRVRPPVTDGAIPAGVDMEHFHPQVGGFINHSPAELLVYVHAAAQVLLTSSGYRWSRGAGIRFFCTQCRS
jgi:hypothetical protein